MSIDRTSRASQFLLIAPALLVILLYVRFGYVPQHKLLAERVTKHNKLESSLREILSQKENRIQSLAKAHAVERELTDVLDTIKQNRTVLVARRATKQDEVFRLAAPASAMARTLTILRHNALICLDCSLLKGQAKQESDTPESLKPLATLLGGVPKVGASRHEYRVALQGRFHDLQQALHALQDQLPDVVTLSIELEASNVRTDQRNWILTFLI